MFTFFELSGGGVGDGMRLFQEVLNYVWFWSSVLKVLPLGLLCCLLWKNQYYYTSHVFTNKAAYSNWSTSQHMPCVKFTVPLRACSSFITGYCFPRKKYRFYGRKSIGSVGGGIVHYFPIRIAPLIIAGKFIYKILTFESISLMPFLFSVHGVIK